MRKSKTFKSILLIVFTLLIVYLLLKDINFKIFKILLIDISLFWVGASFVFYLLSYYFRALRFKNIFRLKIKMSKLFSIVSLHTLVNNILPARTGEFSFIYLIRKESIRGTKAMSSLIAVRIFDLIVISLILFVSILFIEDIPTLLGNSLLVLAIVLLFMVLVLLSLIVFSGKLVMLLEMLISFFNLERFKFMRYVKTKSSLIISDFNQINSLWKLLELFVTSLLIWFFQYYCLYFLIIAMHLDLNFFFLLIGISFRMLSVVLPIQGVGGFGTTEGLWALPLVLFGIPYDIAIASGFLQHFIIIFFFLVVGLYGYLSLKFLGKKS